MKKDYNTFLSNALQIGDKISKKKKKSKLTPSFVLLQPCSACSAGAHRAGAGEQPLGSIHRLHGLAAHAAIAEPPAGRGV